MIVIISRYCGCWAKQCEASLSHWAHIHPSQIGWKKLIKSSDLSGDWGRVKHKLAVCRPCTNGGRIWTQIGGKNTVQIIAVHTSPQCTQIGRLHWRIKGGWRRRHQKYACLVLHQKMHKLYSVQRIFTCTCVHMCTQVHHIGHKLGDLSGDWGRVKRVAADTSQGFPPHSWWWWFY